MDLPFAWRISRIAGIAAIILYLSFLSIAWCLAPVPYSPLENWLSDFGNSGLNPKGAIFFNTGMVISGLCFFFFVPGFSRWLTKKPGRRMNVILILAAGFMLALSIAMAGFYSEDYGWIHSFWSAVLFTALGFFLFLSGYLFARSSARPLAYYGFAAGITDIALGLVFRAPVLEWITIFAAFGYVGLVSWQMPRIDLS